MRVVPVDDESVASAEAFQVRPDDMGDPVEPLGGFRRGGELQGIVSGYEVAIARVEDELRLFGLDMYWDLAPERDC